LYAGDQRVERRPALDDLTEAVAAGTLADARVGGDGSVLTPGLADCGGRQPRTGIKVIERLRAAEEPDVLLGRARMASSNSRRAASTAGARRR
jgi:hypothetical protein